jgi:DNA-binding MarR family transcriptional regulator
MVREVVVSTDRSRLLEEVRRADRAYGQSFVDMNEAVIVHLGIMRTEARCLDVLERHGAMTAKDVGRSIGMGSSGVTTLVDRLERAGLATRATDPEDRRRVVIDLTDRARDLLGMLFGPVEQNGRWIRSLSDEELGLVRDLLRVQTRRNARNTARILALSDGAAMPGPEGGRAAGGPGADVAAGP